MADQLDMGAVPVDSSEVQIPADEKLFSFLVELTRSDQKWCRFEVGTTLRTQAIEPGIVGETAFKAFCQKVRAMYETDEGQAVLAAIRTWLAEHPVKFTSVTQQVEETP